MPCGATACQRPTFGKNSTALWAFRTPPSIARFQNGQPILYFTWTPYWVSGAPVPGKDVEWLDVPYTSLPDGVVAETTFDG